MSFQVELATACQEYAEKYNYPGSQLGRGFEAFMVHISAADGTFLADPAAVADPMHADLSDFILRQNEGGVDGYLEDDSNKVLLLIQAKYLTGKKPVDEDALKAFFDLPNVLASPAREAYLASLDHRARTLLTPLQDRLKDGWSVVLRFACNRPITERQSALAAAREATYAEAGASVTCEYVGQDSIKAIWREAMSGLGGIQEAVSLQFADGRILTLDDPRQTIVGIISGNELAGLFKQHHNQLFAQNIRLPLLSSTRINPDIASTAKQSPGDFFYFNNGVSAVCSRFTEEAGRVSAWDLQIINGAQTVGTLGGLASVSRDLRVLFRLTTAPTEESSFREEITRTNNTQNEVVPWDFRANDGIQKWLESALQGYSGMGPLPNFWYKRKRGLDAQGRGGRALEPEYFGKLRHAYLYGPVPSYKEPKRLASLGDAGLYRETFGVNGELLQNWPKNVLDEAVFTYALDFHISAKADQYRKNGHDYGRWLKRLSRYVVAMLGDVARKAQIERLEPRVMLTLSPAEFTERVNVPLRVAMSKINDRYELTKAERVQPEYDIARDQKTFDQLCSSVIADLTA